MTRLLPVALVCIAACALPAYAQSQKTSKPRAAAVDSSYGQRAEALRWADELAQKQGIDPAWLRQQLAQAQKLEQVRRLMTPSTGPKKTTARSWAVYRSRFIDPVRVQAGKRFWQENAAALERAGHTVVDCENGDDAIDALEQGPYDLLLTDIVMPGADGIEVARVAAARQPGLRIMFITGFAAVALSAAQASPQAKVLSKPVHLRDLVNEVERMIAA